MTVPSIRELLATSSTLTIKPRTADEPLFRADTPEAVHYLAPILGPTATLLLYKLANDELAAGVLASWIDVDELGAALGGGRDRPGPIAHKALERLELFGFLRVDDVGERVVSITTEVGPWGPRSAGRLPRSVRLRFHRELQAH